IDLVSNGNGTAAATFDYSALGAHSVTFTHLAADGTTISSNTIDGPVLTDPVFQVVFHCPPGTTVYYSIWHGRLCNTCPWIDVIVGYCDGTMFTDAFVITPNTGPGVPSYDGVTSMMVTGRGMSSMTVSAANLGTFAAKCSGLGSAQI